VIGQENTETRTNLEAKNRHGATSCGRSGRQAQMWRWNAAVNLGENVNDHVLDYASFAMLNFPLTDLLKPYKSEALLRLRHSSLFLITLIIVTFLVPFPNPLTAWHVVNNAHVGKGKWMWWICATGTSQTSDCSNWIVFTLWMQELAVIFLLLLNIVQSIYALKFPRKPLQIRIPSHTPRPGLTATPLTPLSRRVDGISTKA
jgi:hypothetical protein